MFSIQNPNEPYIRKAALLLLTLVAFGSGFISLLHGFEPSTHTISLVLPPLNSVVHLILLLYLYRYPDSLITVLWIGTTTVLGSMIIGVWYFTLQAALSAEILLIDTLPPVNSVPLAIIVTMFIFAQPNRVLMTAIVSWLCISLPVLIYLIFHPDELFAPRGLDITLTLLPVMGTILVLIPVYRGIEKKVAALNSERARMQRLSEQDPLTQIYNRRGMEDLFSEIATKSNTNIGVIMFDIDHFKHINDRHGHDTGDTVLRQVVGRCRAVLRKDDLFARWGGEEFLIVVQGAENKDLHRIAENLRITLSAEPIQSVGQVTASFGVTRLYPTDSIESLLQRVDEAMYSAKCQGRNRVVDLWEENVM